MMTPHEFLLEGHLYMNIARRFEKEGLTASAIIARNIAEQCIKLSDLAKQSEKKQEIK
jgi:hypothetical protein